MRAQRPSKTSNSGRGGGVQPETGASRSRSEGMLSVREVVLAVCVSGAPLSNKQQTACATIENGSEMPASLPCHARNFVQFSGDTEYD